MTDEEIWKPVEGWLLSYEVSNHGRVRSLDREVWIKNPWGLLASRFYRGRVLRSRAGKPGYLIVCLTGPGRKRETHSVHVLVARHFLGAPPPGTEVCHNDGNKLNCYVGNLRWGTRASNAADKVTHGRVKPARGEKSGSAKLTDAAVRAIRSSDRSARALAREFGVTHKTVCSVRNKESWTHV